MTNAYGNLTTTEYSRLMPIDWKPFHDILARHDSFVLTSHCRADCDAVGSELALARVLEAKGKQVQIVNGDEVPEHIRFLDRQGRVAELGKGVTSEQLLQCECLIVVDTSAWGQLGPMAEVVKEFPGTRVLIDHHVSGDDLGATEFKDSTAEATGRLILELAEELEVEITTEIAEPLFTAIATDTGWFRFSSVTEKTFAALTKLVAAGVRPPEIFSALYEQHKLPRVLLRGRIFERVTPECSGRLMWTFVRQSDFAELGANTTDTEDAINTLLTVAGSEVAILFVELELEKTKVSLRSRSEFDVRALAEQFGGGGHRAAAGITIDEPLDTVREKVLNASRAALES